ncbi:SLC13 family permease [Chromobacterium phragmitis]|uniref:Cyclic nucleotide-binding domain-containing protein n=1 Tax=Chromobacterium phragmitis TaxID=2202141 RepID=A0A344UFV0_9NEIS|nr:SLC13 family permease [Chromobacterium phragmitis]AXE34148.1 hypothetical protein DK843_07430 [Chromobacterium phragmitis]
MREPDDKELEEFWRHPALQALPPEERARLAGQLRLLRLEPDQALFADEQTASHAYLMRSGGMKLRQREKEWRRRQGFIGGEAALGEARRRGDAWADGEATLYALPLAPLRELAERHPGLRRALQDELPPHLPPAPAADGGGWRELAGWLTACAAPPLAWWWCASQGASEAGAVFIGILAATAAMWIFNLVPAFAPALFALLAVVLFDVAPVSTAAAGFASNGFFMLLSVFAVGALMTLSGLTTRISLRLLRSAPAGQGWRRACLLLYGLALTPVMPSQLARGAIVSPFLGTLLEQDGRRPREGAALFASAIAGISLAAAVFLTGKPANLVVFGLFDSQTQFAFDWLPWLCAASFSGALLLLAHWLAMRLLFPATEAPAAGDRLLRLQAEALGPLSRKERGALAAIALILLGTLSQPYHQVDVPWLSLAILVVLLLFGALRREDLNQRVDWSVLIFIGSIIAWAPIMHQTGIDRQIAASLAWVGAFMKASLPAFLALLCAAIVLIRLALPELVAEVLLLTLLLPLAAAAGVSQWLIGYAVLTMCEAYQFAYQSPYQLYLESQHPDGAFDRARLLRYNLAMTLARALAIFASLPFWSLRNIL